VSLDGYEETSLEAVEAVLDGNPSSSADVYLETLAHSERALAAVAAKRAGGGGGGGTPAGDDLEIQFNDDGAFGASPKLRLEISTDTASLLLGEDAVTEATMEIKAVGDGTQIQLLAAPGGSDYTGGEVVIHSGNATDNNGGDITISAGTDTGEGDGGGVTIESGSSFDGSGGQINIRANASSTAGYHGGAINIVAGSGAFGGGNLILQAGSTTGNVQVYAGDTNQALQLDANGLHVLTTKLGFFSSAPVVQPTGVAVTVEDIHAALVSLGLITA